MTPQGRHIPDSLLERYLVDALDAQLRSELEMALSNSPADKARLEELRADSEAFLLQHPPGPLVERFRQQPQAVPWWRRPMLLVPVAIAVAMVLLVLPLPPIDDPDILTKGAAILVVHRKTDTGSEVVSPSMTVAPGDSVRFEVKASSSGYLAVLGLDARGMVTIYHPHGGMAAAPHDFAQPFLTGAFVLDETLGREDLYVLTSPRPFTLEWAVQALKQGRELKSAAPSGVAVGRTSLTKARE